MFQAEIKVYGQQVGVQLSNHAYPKRESKWNVETKGTNTAGWVSLTNVWSRDTTEISCLRFRWQFSET